MPDNPDVSIWEAIEELKAVWSLAADVEVEKISADFQQEIQDIIDSIKWFNSVGNGKIDQSRLEGHDISIQELYGYGTVICPDHILPYYKNMYPYFDIRWLLRVRVMRSKFLIVKKKLMAEVNQKGPGWKLEDYRSQCSKGIYDPSCSYRRFDWCPQDFDGHVVDPKSLDDFKDFLNGKLVFVHTGFFDIPKTDYACTLLLPDQIYFSEHDILVYWWALFPQDTTFELTKFGT